jgi:cytidyltransferase-like protein
MSIVYTGGTFDLPHRGHVKLLETCRKIAGAEGEVIVSLNTDEFIEKFKGKPPIMSYSEREAMLYAYWMVTDVIENTGGNDSKPAILEVIPDFIVVGSDWAKKDYYAQMQFTQEWLDINGITLVYVPYTDGISTSEIKRRIADV